MLPTAGTLTNPTSQGTVLGSSGKPYKEVPGTATSTAWDSSTPTQHKMWPWALMELRQGHRPVQDQESPMESSVAQTLALQRTTVISGFSVNFTELRQMERNCGEISNLHFLVYQAFSACLTMMNAFGFGLPFFFRKLPIITKKKEVVKWGK